MTHPDERHRRRFKKRYIIWTVLLAGLAAFGGFRLHADSRLEQRMTELEAQGFPMSLAEMNIWYRDTFSQDREDAWPVYLDAIAAYVAWDREAQKDLPVYSDEIAYGRGQSWSAFHLQEAQAFLADNQECLDLLYEAADVGYSFRRFDFSQGHNMRLDWLSETRDCGRLLSLDAQVAAQGGDICQAVRAIRAIFVLADSLQGPMTIMYLIQRSIWLLGFQSLEDLLSLHPLTPEHIQTLEALLEPIETRTPFTHSLIGERCMGLYGFKMPLQEIIMLSSGNSEERLLVPLIALRKVMGLHDRDALGFINVVQAHIEAASLPRHEALVRMGELEREYENKLGLMTRMLSPGFTRTFQFELQGVAGSLCARAGLAVERYRLAQGQLPTTIEELVPTFLPSVPLDPFDGKPLRFRHLDKGYVVYSVGQDLTDNQGEARKPRNERKGQTTWDETFTVAR